MKRILLNALLLLAGSTAFAQLQVSTKSFDLESQNKHKGWVIIDAGIDEKSQKTYLKFASPSCDIETSRSGSMITTTFKGLIWNIDKLYFDKDFNYINTVEKKYDTSEDAILNGEIIYKKKFNVISGEPLFTALAMPTGKVDYSYMFTKIVTGVAGITGFKVGVSKIGIKVGGSLKKYGADECFENPAAFKISVTDAKEAKGQLWIPTFNHPIPNGGHVLFNTGYVNPDLTKTHNVFRKYDENADIIKEKVLTFDYQCLVYGKEIEQAPGKFDYVFLTRTINYKKSTGKVAPANQYEYIRIDGTTFDTKEQITFTAPNSQWTINQVFEKDGAVYLSGTAGKTATTYLDFSIPKPSDFPNFQIAKIENGKLVYAKSFTPENIETALMNVNGEKTKSDLNFNMYDLQMDAVNGKFIYSGRFENLKTAVFSETGDLEAFIVKEAEYSKGYFTFTKDKKTMYLIVQDVTEYNKWDKKTGTITAKESKQLLTAPSIITYDLASKNIKYESLKNDNWGLQFNEPIVLDNDDKILLVGGNITKKAKESEVVFVSIKK
jgi:hypothetical protein